jgi:hypothetical protein
MFLDGGAGAEDLETEVGKTLCNETKLGPVDVTSNKYTRTSLRQLETVHRHSRIEEGFLHISSESRDLTRRSHLCGQQCERCDASDDRSCGLPTPSMGSAPPWLPPNRVQLN